HGPGEPGNGHPRPRRAPQLQRDLRPDGGGGRVSDASGGRAGLVSLVIPTYRRKDSLVRVLAGVAALDWPAGRLEILVVSDGGGDGSVEMARAFPLPFPLRAMEQPNQGP